MMLCWAALAALLQGCASPKSRMLDRIKEPRSFYAQANGESRLFSSIGFILVDDSLQGRLALAFDDAGRFDEAKLRALVPDADVFAKDSFFRLRHASSTWKDVWIGNGRVASLEPALDDVVTKFMNALREGESRILPIFVPTNAR